MDGEIVKMSDIDKESAISAIADTSLVALGEQAEARLDAMVKIKRIALKATNPSDWVDEGGKPYLQASGSEKVARIFGVSWQIGEPVYEPLDGGHYMYTFNGVFSIGGASIDAVGSRSTKDAFFSVRYKGKGDEREKITLPPSEIDRGNVKKSAYTNLLSNGITRLLGLRNLSWDDLRSFAEITQEQVQGVQFKKGSKSAPPARSSGQPAKVANPDAPASDAQVGAIHTLIGKLGITDEMAKHEKVAELLKLKKVPTSMNALNKQQASDVIGMLQKEVDGNGVNSGASAGSENQEDQTSAGQQQ